MKKRKIRITLFFKILIALISFTSCDLKNAENNVESEQADLSTLEKEIELRLREYENHLQNGDSMALGNM